MASVLVSGGTGYVGRFIVEALLDAGHVVTVFGLTAPRRGFFSREVGFVEGSLDPDRDQERAFAGIDHFVHAAFHHLPGRYRGGEGDDPTTFRRLNAGGSIALFEQARRAGVKRVVFLSSRAVYGRQPPGTALTENTPPLPDTLYAQVKREAERALAGLSGEDFAGVSLRVTGVYGPGGLGKTHKWAELFRAFLGGKAVAPRVASEVHGADVGAAVRRALEADQESVAAEVFNVSDIVLDRRDLLAEVNRVTGSDFDLPPRGDRSALIVMATDKLEALGWRPGGIALLEDTVKAMCDRTMRPVR